MANTVRVTVSAAIVAAAVAVVFPKAVANVKATNSNEYVAGAWSVIAPISKDRIEIALYTSGKLVTQKTTAEQDDAILAAIKDEASK